MKMPDPSLQTFFTKEMLRWHTNHPRPLPWKDTSDPYVIWLSEIILQQTRVEQGTPYFLRFREAYPTIHELAAAPEDEILKLWEGLGYYSRARNMHAAARHISEELDGKFPDNYNDILKLKGVGPYTAAAIASFSFGLPHAVVDGNVYRVLARFFGIETPTDTTSGKKEFTALANQLIPADQPGSFNQAIMNFGALQCTPATPDCAACPLHTVCEARKKDLIARLPVKAKAKARKDRYFHYLVMTDQHEQTLIEKRQQKDIWRGLYQFPLIEAFKPDLRFPEVQKLAIHNLIPMPGAFDILASSKAYRQTLSHQNIYARFWEIRCKELPEPAKNTFHLVARNGLSNFAFPRIIDWYLGDNTLYLDLR